VLAVLDHGGLADNTLVFFASDNGPVWYPQDVKKYGHAAAGPLRGMKGDAWEAGHREPFIARWPGKVHAGTTSTTLVDFTDLLATFASLTGATLPANAGEDSFSFLPQLLGQKDGQPARTEMALFAAGQISLRQGDWELIPFLGSGGFSKPTKVKPKPGEPAGQLYDLAHDLGETTNVYDQHPDVVKAMTARIAQLREQGRSRRE
jgi:arylsulfatase A